MIDANAVPGRDSVALVAVGRRTDMIAGLARGGDSVMAQRAGARDAGVVERYFGPAPRRMTILAIFRSPDVSRRPARGDASVMTGAAKARRSVKNAVEVAAFAFDRPVQTFERKAGLDVIGDLVRRRNGRRLDNEQRAKRADQRREPPQYDPKRGGDAHPDAR